MSERLDEETVEAIAVRVVELLGDGNVDAPGDCRGARASTWHVSLDRLRARGRTRRDPDRTGPRARLRFDLARVLERLGSEPDRPRPARGGRGPGRPPAVPVLVASDSRRGAAMTSAQIATKAGAPRPRRSGQGYPPKRWPASRQARSSSAAAARRSLRDSLPRLRPAALPDPRDRRPRAGHEPEPRTSCRTSSPTCGAASGSRRGRPPRTRAEPTFHEFASEWFEAMKNEGLRELAPRLRVAADQAPASRTSPSMPFRRSRSPRSTATGS